MEVKQLVNNRISSNHGKVFDFFYNLSKLVASENTSPKNIYQRVVDLIPAVWQYPDATCAKLIINDYEFKTKVYRKTKWQQEGDLLIDGKKNGSLIVGYLEKKPKADEGPFLIKEREMLTLICEWVSQVAKRHQIKTIIQSSDIKFRTLVDDVTVGVYICDREGTFIYANRPLARMLGCEDICDLQNKRFVDFLPPNRKKVLYNQFLKSMETGKYSERITTEVIRLDGERGTIEIRPVTLITDGKIMGSQGVVIDISDTKATEEKIRHETTHDTLTGIYNRTFFEAEMDRLERGRQFPVSVVVVHMDSLNKSQKIETADDPDKKIKRVAHTLFQSYRGDDIVARIEENQFAILLPNVDEEGADITVKRINENLHEYRTKSKDSKMKFYIGTSTAAEASRLETILDQAQAIVVLAKKKGSTD